MYVCRLVPRDDLAFLLNAEETSWYTEFFGGVRLQVSGFELAWDPHFLLYGLFILDAQISIADVSSPDVVTHFSPSPSSGRAWKAFISFAAALCHDSDWVVCVCVFFPIHHGFQMDDLDGRASASLEIDSLG